MKVTGLFFGTFNPIHVGHLILAQFLLENTDMDELWFMVTPQSPFKKNQKIENDRIRLSMVHEVIKDQPKMKAVDEEFYLPKPSYTVTTLLHLSEKYPDRKFALIMGHDNLCHFKKWKNWEFILENHPIYVYPRHGEYQSDLDNHPQVHLTEAPIIEISSSQIREGIKQGKNLSYLVSKETWDYIQKNNLYG